MNKRAMNAPKVSKPSDVAEELTQKLLPEEAKPAPKKTNRGSEAGGKSVLIRMTADEAETLSKAASRSGMPLATFIRSAAIQSATSN